MIIKVCLNGLQSNVNFGWSLKRDKGEKKTHQKAATAVYEYSILATISGLLITGRLIRGVSAY